MRNDIARSLSIATIRIGEYMRAFGFRGLFFSLVHFLKFKTTGTAANVRATSIPGWGVIFLRPRTSDLATFREIFVNGEYDPRRHNVFPLLQRRYNAIRSAKRTPLIVDAGANIGLATVYLSRFFPEADFILIDAHPRNAEMARRNTALLPKAHVLTRASCTLFVKESEDYSTAAVCEGNSPTAVEAVTMNEVVKGREKDLLVVKMDIEGAEIGVLSRNNEWLAAAPVLMIEPHDGIINKRASLAGLLSIDDYRNGKLMINGSTLIFIPLSSCDEA